MYICVDLGGTKIVAGLADASGKILHKEIVKTDKSSDPLNVIQQLSELAKGLASGQKNIKIGIGIPGQVKNGCVINMPNIPQLNGVDLLQKLTEFFPAEYVIENDASAAAVAELKYGAGQGYKNFIYVTISTGIGGGIIIDGKLYTGANGTAGEFGHTVILPDGPPCGCGNRGCWEALGSGTALAKMAEAKISSGTAPKLKERAKDTPVNVELLVEAAKQGDTDALELLDVNGYFNALGLANLVNTFDPEVIILGGGLSFNGDYFFQPLLKSLKMFKLLNSQNSIQILPAGCKQDAGLLGAISLVMP